jgi:hypothetical protein
MNLALWVATGLLAAVFTCTGLAKLVRSREQLVAAGLGWTEDFEPRPIKLFGVLELLGAAGLILPGALTIAPILVPFAAIGLVPIMGGAAATHLRRREWPLFWFSVVLMALLLFVAWGRLIAVPFA